MLPRLELLKYLKMFKSDKDPLITSKEPTITRLFFLIHTLREQTKRIYPLSTYHLVKQTANSSKKYQYHFFKYSSLSYSLLYNFLKF